MTVNLTRIYTRLGDSGETHLGDMSRVPKTHPRIEAYGTVDELNALLGVARSHGLDAATDHLVARLQNELFLVGSALADPLPDGRFHNTVTHSHVEYLEQTIDSLEAELEPLLQFILPGGAVAAAYLHLARTVCRRSERLAVELSQKPDEAIAQSVLVYLNRLSDLLFVLARSVNHKAGVADVIWKGV